MSDLAVLDRPTTGYDLGDEHDQALGAGRCAHIVAGTEKDTGIELVMQARVFGVPVTALCGYTWVPERDPKRFPLCSRCRAVREQARPDQPTEGIPA